MKKTKQETLSVKDSLIYLHSKGLAWTEVWLRQLISRGAIKSMKIFNSRVIEVSELDRLIAENLK